MYNQRNIFKTINKHFINRVENTTMATKLLLDTEPIPVLSYERHKKRSDFRGQAAYGVCASRNLKYFGFKLVALSTLDEMPVVYELISANTDERIAAKAVPDSVWGYDIFQDCYWSLHSHHCQNDKPCTERHSAPFS